jgi:hypothetical protein
MVWYFHSLVKLNLHESACIYRLNIGTWPQFLLSHMLLRLLPSKVRSDHLRNVGLTHELHLQVEKNFQAVSVLKYHFNGLVG